MRFKNNIYFVFRAQLHRHTY